MTLPGNQVRPAAEDSRAFTAHLENLQEDLLVLILSLVGRRKTDCKILNDRLNDFLQSTDYLWENPGLFPDENTRIAFFTKIKESTGVLHRRMKEKATKKEELIATEIERLWSVRPEYERSIPLHQPWKQFLSSGAPGSGTGMCNHRQREHLQIIPEPGIKILESWKESFRIAYVDLGKDTSELSSESNADDSTPPLQLSPMNDPESESPPESFHDFELRVVENTRGQDWECRKREMNVWCAHERFTRRPQEELRKIYPPSMAEYSRLFEEWRSERHTKKKPVVGSQWRIMAVKHFKKVYFDDERGYHWWDYSDDCTDYGIEEEDEDEEYEGSEVE